MNPNNIKFIKLRGRPRKKISLTHSQVMFLMQVKQFKLGGYLIRLEES